MNLYIPLALISIIISAIFYNNKHYLQILFFVFMLISLIFASIRFEFGSDYFQYRDIFDNIKAIGVYDYHLRDDHTELAFLYFLNLFPSYYFFIAFQSICWFSAVYFFLQSKLDLRYLWFTFFLLFFDANNILNNYVALRTSFVGIIFLFAYQQLLNNHKLRFIFLIILSSFFHKSSILLVLLIFIIPSRKIFGLQYEKLYSFITLVFIIAMLFSNYITTFAFDFIVNFSPSFFEKYETYEAIFSDRTLSIGNIITNSIFMIQIYCLLFALQHESDISFQLILKTSIIAKLAILIFGSGLMSRYIMILDPVILVGIIRSLKYLTTPYRIIDIGSIVLLTLFNFYNYLMQPYSVSFLRYQTIFQ